MKEDRMVRVNELTVDELISRLISKAGWVTIAKHLDDLVIFVQQRDHAAEVGNNHHIMPEEAIARASHTIGIELDKLAIHREVLQAMILSVGNGQEWLVSASVEPKTVWALDLALIRSRASKGAYPVCIFVVLMNPTGAISIGDIETTVWAESDVGRNERGSILIDTWLFRCVLLPDHLALKISFYNNLVSSVAMIQELFVSLLS